MIENKIQNIIKHGETESIEFKKNFDNSVIISLNAFANTKGGKVLIGINDDRSISGIEINSETIQNWINEVKNKTNPSIIPFVEVFQIDEKKIAVFEIDEYPIKPVSLKGRYFRRIKNANHQMSVNEVANEHLRTINSSWDYYNDANHNFDHVSIVKIEKYIEEYEKWNNTKVDFEPIEFLNKHEILRNGKITFGAYLLFAKELCIISDIQIGRFKSETKIIDSLSLNTDIFTELEEILAFIKKHLMVEFIITGNAQREERFDFPLNAIREIVINMIIHRDYRESSGSIIKIYDDRIEFYNPGGLYGDLTLDELLNFNYKSQARNKLIAKAFKEIGKIEKYGTGIKRIFSICKNHNVISPKINISNGGFEVVLYKQKFKVPDEVPDEVSDKVPDNLTINQKKILELIKINKSISMAQMADEIGISKRKILDNINKLKSINLLERVGSTKSGCWKVTK